MQAVKKSHADRHQRQWERILIFMITSMTIISYCFSFEIIFRGGNSHLTVGSKLISQTIYSNNSIDNQSIKQLNLSKDDLQFIHIPKTGGTTISTIMKKTFNVSYSAELYNYHNIRSPLLDRKHRGYIWHTPQHWFTNFAVNNTAAKALNAMYSFQFRGKKTFCVVRNPWQRLVSEFRFQTCPTNDMNEWFQKSIAAYRNNPAFYSCHWVPQNEFIWDPVTGRQNCDHILRFTHLMEDLRNLTRLYGFDSSKIIDKSHNKGKLCNDTTMFTLDTKSIELFESMYADDFKKLHKFWE